MSTDKRGEPWFADGVITVKIRTTARVSGSLGWRVKGGVRMRVKSEMREVIAVTTRQRLRTMSLRRRVAFTQESGSVCCVIFVFFGRGGEGSKPWPWQ